jgi:peptidyl-prolyl cis-trans isomerase D
MAVIGKIRKRSGLLIAVIGVALAAFVLGDFAKGNKRQTINIGVVNGENLNIQDFNRKFEENVEATRQQRQEDRLPQDELFRIRETTWNQMLQQIIMEEEYKKLGLALTSEELFDQVQGPNPHQAIIQNFQNPETGLYDRTMVLNYLQNLDNMQQNAKDQWITFEKYLKEDRLRTKYQNLITKGFYTPKAFANLIHHEKNDMASIEYVGVRYTAVPDSLVNLTDADYNAFYNTYKKNYEREDMRDVEYIVFDIAPSAEDTRTGQNYVQSLVDEFRITDNIVGFVNANSETRYDSTWLGVGEVPVTLESVMFEQEPGYIYGPYFEDGSFKLARLVDVNFRPDSLKASHILISYAGSMRSEQTRTKEQAQALADSLLAEVKKTPSKLMALAATMSDDQSAAMNSGDLGWFRDGQMVPQFNQFVLDNKVGTIGIVETDFGFHIVEVTGKKDPAKKLRLAVITHQVTASTKTYQDVFAKASKFATENKTSSQFNATIENEGLNKRVAPSLRAMASRIPGIENPRQIIRWAFDEETEVGDVSTIFDLDDMFVVALLTKKDNKGIPSLADIKEQIKPQVMNKKKGEMIVEKMKAMNNDLSRIASEYNSELQSLGDLTFESRMLGAFGQESKVIGEIFAANQGESLAIAGSNSAFAVKLNSINKAAETQFFDQIKNESRMNFESNVRNNAAFRALEKVSKIDDNRMLFY